MKNKRTLLTFVLGLMILILLGPQTVTAQAILSEYTAVETSTGITLDPGDWHYLPTGGVHFRGQVTTAYEDASDPRASGDSTLVVNANLDPGGTGPVWGTIDIEVADSVSCPGGGVWHGTWAGKMSFSEGYIYWFGAGRGVSGCVEGLQIRYESDRCILGTPCPYTGTLVDPHGE